jgi:transposase
MFFAASPVCRSGVLSQIDRHVLRLEKSQPLLKQIRRPSKRPAPAPCPRALWPRPRDYTLTLWSRLSRFLEYPEVELSNNLAENDAPGRSWPAQLDTRRKSRGWTTSCRNHSIVETCRRLGLPLRDYLGSVLTGLADFPSNRGAELTSSATSLPSGCDDFGRAVIGNRSISCLDTQPNTRGKRIEQKITKRWIISVLSRTG